MLNLYMTCFYLKICFFKRNFIQSTPSFFSLYYIGWINDCNMTTDSFKVPTLNKDWNLYNKYASNNNRFSTGVHQYVHETSFGKYAFTGIDLAPVPGPGRPFNFFALPSPVSSLYIINLLFFIYS